MPNMKPQAVVFDLGGVLIDWDPRYLYRKLLPDTDAMERFLATVCTPAWNVQQDAGRSLHEATEELVARYPDSEDLVRAFYGRWEEMLAGTIDGTVKILTGLEESGVPLYALTNWSAETFPVARERFPFLSLFEDIVVSGEERLIKPDARIYDVLLARAGRPADQLVFIDDNKENVAAARRKGMTAIHFTAPEPLGRDLTAIGFPC